jgi:hypothetical protein
MGKFAVQLVLPLLAGTLAAAQMSHEEATVRATYAKLAYAHDAYNVQKQIDNYELKGANPDQVNPGQALSEVADEHIQFELSEFKVGNIRDMKGNYEDYVSEPKGEDVLSVVPTEYSVNENGKTVESWHAQVRWTRGQHTGENWKTPATTLLLKPIDGNTYQRYAAYRVMVKYQEGTRDYRALALFLPGQPEQVFFVDLVTGNHALNVFFKADVTQKTLTQTSLSSNPIAEEWLRKNSLPPSTPQNQGPHN